MILRAPQRERTQDEEEDVLVLGKKRYAVGLVWFTADADLVETTALVKQRSKHLSADFYCSRATIASQQGFGFLSKGHRMGMLSAAALAADALIGEWHGIFAADNGWWYVCVHSDAVAPEGDRFFHSEEDAYNHFIQASEIYKWPRSYAPAAWNLPNTNGEIILSRILEDNPSASSLRPITLDAFFGGPQRKKVVLSSSVVFVLLVLAMISVLVTVSSGQKSGKQNLSPFILSAPVGDIIKPPPPPPLRKGGSGDIALQISPPDKVLAACMGSFDKLMVPLPGWDMKTLSCDGTMAAIEWKKISGSLAILQTALRKFPQDTMISYTGADRFVVKIKVPVVKTKPSRIMNLDTAVLFLNKQFTDIGSMQVKPVIPKAPPARATQRGAARGGTPKAASPAVPPPAPEPPYLDFTLVSSTPPTSLSWAFDVSGLKLQNVAWDLGSRNWTYKARILFNNEVASNARTTP